MQSRSSASRSNGETLVDLSLCDVRWATDSLRAFFLGLATFGLLYLVIWMRAQAQDRRRQVALVGATFVTFFL
jgi:hypothetical protein